MISPPARANGPRAAEAASDPSPAKKVGRARARRNENAVLMAAGQPIESAALQLPAV